MNRIKVGIALLCLASVGLTGCVTPMNTSGYIPPDEEGVTTAGLDHHDYMLVVEEMVASMMRHGLLKESGEKPHISSGPIYSDSPYHYKPRMFGECMRSDLMKSGLATFSTATDFEHKGGESQQLYKQLEFQNESGHVDPGTAAQYGKIIGADYLVYGNIYYFARPPKRPVEVTYQFNFTITEIETAKAVWTHGKAIRKKVR